MKNSFVRESGVFYPLNERFVSNRTGVITFRRGLWNALETRRVKAIPWDAWARERNIGMICEVKLAPRLIS